MFNLFFILGNFPGFLLLSLLIDPLHRFHQQPKGIPLVDFSYFSMGNHFVLFIIGDVSRFFTVNGSNTFFQISSKILDRPFGFLLTLQTILYYS